jgi:hypothetical protein
MPGNTANTAEVLPYSQVPQLQLVGSMGGATTYASPNRVWKVWTQTINISTASTTALATTGSAGTNAIWGLWVQSTETGTTVTTGTTITAYTAAVTSVSGIVYSTSIWDAWSMSLVGMREASAEQVADAQRRQEAYRDHQLRVQVERNAANDRAEKLLLKVLSPKQREELKAKNFFTLETLSKNGERRIYRINRGRSGNVEQVDATGRRIKRLCAHPAEAVPDADTMLGQKFMLETAEDDFLRVANHS